MQDYPTMGITLIDSNNHNISNFILKNMILEEVQKKNTHEKKYKNDIELKYIKYTNYDDINKYKVIYKNYCSHNKHKVLYTNITLCLAFITLYIKYKKLL